MREVIGVEKPVTPLEAVPAITRVPPRFPSNSASPVRMTGSGFPRFPVGSRRFPRSVPVLRAMQSGVVPVVPAPLKGAGPSGTALRIALPFGVSGAAGTMVPLASARQSLATDVASARPQPCSGAHELVSKRPCSHPLRAAYDVDHRGKGQSHA